MILDQLKAAGQLRRDEKRQRRVERKLKKDAVLHLRVEGDVMERVKAEAHARGMSVSNLVRCRLTECFSEPHPAEGPPEFLLATRAFSEAVTMREGRCAVCGEVLPRGARVLLAYGPPPPERMVCGKCFDSLQPQPEKPPCSQRTGRRGSS